MRLRVLCLAGAIAALLVGVTPARAQIETNAPEGSIGIRLLDAPTNRADDPRAKLYIVDHVNPGTTISRRVQISNGTKDTIDVPVYAAAATIDGDAFQFGDGRARNELTSWTSVEPTPLTVSSRGVATATVTIAVPPKASEGERYAVVWAETPASSPQGGGISAVNRVGIRIYLSVGPGGEPASNFEVTRIEARRSDDGIPIVAAFVKNTGKRALDLSGELRLSGGPAGLSAGPFQAELAGTLAIGSEGVALARLDKALPAGPWDATVTFDSGLLQRSKTGRITFPAAGEGTPASATSSPVKTAVFVGATLAVAAFVAWFFLLRRRSRDTGEAAA